MNSPWYRLLHRYCTRLYFSRVTVVHPERLPASGPVLYLGLHRNGAVDGFIYHTIVPRAVFLISTQLRKNFFGRLFFDGITVVRKKDEGDQEQNTEALAACLNLLRSGGELFVFPEGTSSLGPRHLPFKSGAAKILLDALTQGVPLQVVPLGIHYECPWSFRSKVEVAIGEPVSTQLPGALTPLGALKDIKNRLKSALEEVGINVESEPCQRKLQLLAYAATLGSRRSYFKTLKALEHAIPTPIESAWRNLKAELEKGGLLRYHDVPLYPTLSAFWYLLVLLVTAPIVAAAIAANFFPFLASCWAGSRFPDAPNVIALWRILIGAPLFLIWAGAVTVLSLLCGGVTWMLGYWACTWLGLKLYYRVKKLAVALHNVFRCPSLRPSALKFHALLNQELPA